jgi:putative transposase
MNRRDLPPGLRKHKIERIRQHCWAHKSRNVLDKVKKVDHGKVKRDLHRISHAKNRQLATQAYWAFCQTYRKVYPGAVKSLESEIDDLLSFYQVKLSSEERRDLDAQGLQKAQKALWRQLRTTNLIERAFREVKRRVKPMGVFNNRKIVWNEFSLRFSLT